MSIKSYLTQRLFGAEIATQVEAQKVASRKAAMAAGGDEEAGWRRLSGVSNRELPIAQWSRQVEICYWLWKTNPLGNWIIETLTSFVAGKGFSWSADNEEIDALLNEFWYDPVNRMDIKLEQKVRELFLFGVQCWPVFKADQTGRVRLGMVDPAQIVQIFADPQNAEVLIGVEIGPGYGVGATGASPLQSRFLKTILAGETDTVVSEQARQMRESYTDGECFLFAVNRVSNDPYGTSDLFVIADWLSEYEEFVFNFADKARRQNSFIWDVTMEGADEAACKKAANDYAVKGEGEIRVHNEKTKWDAVAPNLAAMELKEAAGVFRNHILGNKSLPEHWYGGGGNVNRSTAGESNEPIMALIGSRQNMVKFIIETIFTYVIQSALDARYLHVAEDEAFAFAVQTPEASNRDLTKISAAVQQITAAIVVGSSQGWVDQATATKLFAFIIALIGFEIDPESIISQDVPPEWKDYQNAGKGENTKTPDSGSTAAVGS
jgi:hypothetical protein